MIAAAVLRQLESLSLVSDLCVWFDIICRHTLGSLLRVLTLCGALPLLLDHTHLVRIRQITRFDGGEGDRNLTNVGHIYLDTVLPLLNGQLFIAV